VESVLLGNWGCRVGNVDIAVDSDGGVRGGGGGRGQNRVKG
jgi:hypothetical protein